MSAFPETSLTLLRKIAVQVTGEREAAWVMFFGLYEPAIKRFVAYHDSAHDPDDVAQDIFLKLVNVVQAGRYDSSMGSFRAFLATMIRRHLVSLYRQDQARGAGLHVNIDDVEPAVPADVAEQIDMKWRLARHQSAIEHVLTKTAISEQSRQIYRELLATGDSCAKVARRMNLPAATVRQVKSRVSRMIAAFEKATE